MEDRIVKDVGAVAKNPEIYNSEPILKDDKEYFDEYFKICQLYQAKRTILSKLKETGVNSSAGIASGKTDSLKKEITSLNEEIETKEGIYWARVEKSLSEGRNFAIEEVVAKHGLELFEKKLILFFLYLEFFCVYRNICTEDELLAIFDTKDSIMSRMRNVKYLRDDSALIKGSFFFREYRKRPESATTTYYLTGRILDAVTQILNGMTLEKEKKEEEERREVSCCDTVGYVKEPEYELKDVLLKWDIKEKVLLFLDTHRDNKFETLGVTERIKNGLGTVFLFYGPSGTGKSMLAEAVASYIHKKVLIVEYPKIMDRWLGQTDKNIYQLFRSAEENDFVLILDEADTLFYNRSFAMAEHDIRFVNEMLQELERFKGVVILTTNMEVLFDQALERRVALKIKFELPSKELCLKIWQSHIPQNIKISEGTDFGLLAVKYEFSGGNIKNAVLNAIRRMASRCSDTLSMEDLKFGADLEKEGMFSQANNPRKVCGFSSS